MHGSVFLDKNDQVIRRATPLERPADRGRMRGDRAAGRRAQEADQDGGQPGADRLHRPEDPLAAQPRAEELRQAPCKVLLPKDEIRRRLTGEFATEVSDASGMLLLDVASADWSKQAALEARSSTSACWPSVYESEDVTGKLTPEAAKTAGPDDRLRGGRRGGRLRGRGRGQRHRQERCCSPPRSAPPA